MNKRWFSSTSWHRFAWVPVLLGLVAASGAPAIAAPGEVATPPLDGNLGLVGTLKPGVEAELGLAPLPVRLGGVFWSPMFGNQPAATFWGGWDFGPGTGDRFTVIAGLTHYVQTTPGCIDTCTPASEGGAFVGASYTFREERLWLRVTPHYYQILGGPTYYPQWAMSGIPWVELGLPLGDHLTISFRLAETLFKVAYTL